MTEVIVESFILNENGQIEVVHRFPSNLMLLCNPPKKSPDKVIKSIYGVVDGEIKLIKTIEGRVIAPSYNPEQIIFE